MLPLLSISFSLECQSGPWLVSAPPETCMYALMLQLCMLSQKWVAGQSVSRLCCDCFTLQMENLCIPIHSLLHSSCMAWTHLMLCCCCSIDQCWISQDYIWVGFLKISLTKLTLLTSHCILGAFLLRFCGLAD